MIKEWLDEFHPRNEEEAKQALREIMQEVALAGLYRGEFFKKAAFYGGTALRIFYQLNRFSEDLDFSLLQTDHQFSLDPFLSHIENEFEALGMHITIKEKSKSVKTNIESAFLKSDTIWKELVLEGVIPQNNLGTIANIRIKLEVDKEPPEGFETEEKLLLRPFSFYVKTFVISDLFAGKMHALLFRKWGKNVKGRDWYDLEWYVRRKTHLNLAHLAVRAKNSGDWNKSAMSEKEFRKLINDRIDAVDINMAKADISRFIPDPNLISHWSKQYFHDLVKLIV